MNTFAINKNGVDFSIERSGRTTATLAGQTTIGWLAGDPHRYVWPRISFDYHAPAWLQAGADHRYWMLDDYETSEETEQRATDSCTFDLAPADVAAIEQWLGIDHSRPAAEQPPQRTAPSEYVEPIFAIGGLNRGDGAEPPAVYPKVGRICRRCGQAESDGAMFTTISNGDICDDCV